MPSRAVPIDFPLLAPEGVPGDTAKGPSATRAAVANTSIGREVEFWFDHGSAILVLHTSNLEILDPYGHLIKAYPEVVCTDQNLVVLRIRTCHTNFPIDYFVYSFASTTAAAGQPSVIRLPDVVPEMASARSVGILQAPSCNGKNGSGYVVANLRVESEPLTAHLDRYYSFKEATEWSQDQVTLPFPKGKEEYMCRWNTELVIPFKGSLLWVDLCRGILHCPNLLNNQKAPTFQYLPLPFRKLDEAGRKRDRRPSRTVGCCKDLRKDVLRFVDLRNNGNGGTLDITIWTAETERAFWFWSNKKMIIPIDYAQLWLDISSKAKLQHGSLPSWELNPLCYPVLSPNNRDIIYLTMVTKNKAWLLQIDMNKRALNTIKDYPGFYAHRNAPHSTNLSKYISKYRAASME